MPLTPTGPGTHNMHPAIGVCALRCDPGRNTAGGCTMYRQETVGRVSPAAVDSGFATVWRAKSTAEQEHRGTVAEPVQQNVKVAKLTADDPWSELPQEPMHKKVKVADCGGLDDPWAEADEKGPVQDDPWADTYYQKNGVNGKKAGEADTFQPETPAKDDPWADTCEKAPIDSNPVQRVLMRKKQAKSGEGGPAPNPTPDPWSDARW